MPDLSAVNPLNFNRRITRPQGLASEDAPALAEQWMKSIGLTRSSTREQVTRVISDQIIKQGNPPVSPEFRGRIIDYAMAVLKGNITEANERIFREAEQTEYARPEMQAWLEAQQGN